RAREDLQVDERRAVLDVPDVEFDPLVPGEARPAVDLSPAGQAGLDLEPAALPGRVAPDLVGERRARADHAHVAADHVPELRQLVDRQAAQRPAGAGDARIAMVDSGAGALALGPDDHRPELEQLELGAVPADPLLPVEHRASV